jgi:hypothetical protein
MIKVHPSQAETTSGNKVIGTSGVLGGVFYLSISAASGTSPSMTVKLQHKDPISGNFVDIVGGSFAAKTAAGDDTLVVYPAVAETANRRVSTVLGDEVNVVWTITGTTPSFTFSISFDEAFV